MSDDPRLPELAARLGVQQGDAWGFVQVLPHSTIPEVTDAMVVLDWLEEYGVIDPSDQADQLRDVVENWHNTATEHTGPWLYCLMEPCYSVRCVEQ